MKNRITIGLITCILLPFFTCAQNWNADWEKKIKRTNTEKFTDVLEVGENEFVVLGSLVPAGKSDRDIWLVRFDKTGNILWEKTYGNNENEKASRFSMNSNNDYIIVGNTIRNGKNAVGFILMVDKDGNELWKKDTDNPECTFNDIISLPDGNVVVAGTESKDSLNTMCLSKYAVNGSLLWQKKYRENMNAMAESIHALPDGGFILAGRNCNRIQKRSDLWIIRFNDNDEEMWNKKYQFDEREIIPKCICCTPDEKLMVAGWSATCMNFGDESNLVMDYDLFLIKISREGDMIWTKNIDSEGNEGGNALAVRPDGKILLAGKKETSFMGRIGPWLLLTDKEGGVMNEHVLPFDFANNQASKIICSSDGGCVAVGPGMPDDEIRHSTAWIIKFQSF